jgi:uncharacterized protein YbjT (DUF2867 family)
MRVLLLGASGFIGRELFAMLRSRGHRVVPVVRPGSAPPPFADEPPVEADLNRDVEPASWIARLAGIDAVVNCAGILQERGSESSDAIHTRAPAALFRACEACGVRRVVLISAISADVKAKTRYAASKLAGEEALRATALDWVVLRPSLVHARGAYGGTALFRALAATPCFIALPAPGNDAFQPIHVDDLAAVVACALESDRLVRRTVEPVGPEVVTLRQILVDYRRWLGLPDARVLAIPRPLVSLACRIGDIAGSRINSTSLAQLEHGNVGDYRRFSEATGLAASGWHDALARHPAHVQDRWHARLYFARPLLRWTLAVLWAASGLLGLASLDAWAPRIAQAIAVSPPTAHAMLAAASGLDLVVALLALSRWRPGVVGAIQAALVAAYTLAGTAWWPGLWLDPLGPLLKNLPILAAIAASAAIGEER